jgi:hypothetical protein
MNESNPYETAEKNLSARFETTEDGTFVLPYSALLFAHLTPTAGSNAAQTLTLFYNTHTVTIEGTRLESLFLLFQKGRAETVRVAGSRASTDAPTVRQITITEGVNRKKA